jgi:hypothetical protein
LEGYGLIRWEKRRENAFIAGLKRLCHAASEAEQSPVAGVLPVEIEHLPFRHVLFHV